MKRTLLAAALALSAAASAGAQDFGQQWVDRVTREIQIDRGPLPTRPVVHEIYMGAIGYYDDNYFLRAKNEESQSAVVPFIRARVDYSERQVDAAADLLASYHRSIPDEEFSDYEQRGFGRLRFVGPRASAEIAAIVQNLSDPVDAVFADRVERLVANAIPRASLELTNTLALEVSANAGYVLFKDDEWETSNNWNSRSDFSVVGHLTNGMDLLGQAGVLAIRYLESAAPPDTDGFYARGGFRGELTQVILVSALAGWVRAESDEFASGLEGEEVQTTDIAFNLQWQMAPKTTLYADFTRVIGFGVDPEPFTVINRVTGILESTLTDDILGRLRGQYDLVDGASDSRRTYVSLSASATYKVQPQVYFEGGVTWRRGDVEAFPADYEYENTIFHLGLIVTN